MKITTKTTKLQLRNGLFLLFAMIGLNVHAQDNYHIYLNDLFTTDYNLPMGEWLFFDTENAIYQNAGNYGADVTVENVTDQEFSQKAQCIIGTAGNNPWDAGWSITNQQTIAAGDKLLAIFYLRSVDGEGEINFFVENNDNFSKEVYLILPVNETWRRYFIPIESTESYAINASSWGFHLPIQLFFYFHIFQLLKRMFPFFSFLVATNVPQQLTDVAFATAGRCCFCVCSEWAPL